MDKRDILELLKNIKNGSIEPEEALLKLKTSPFDDLGYAKVDLHRGLRQGACEVIYGQNKSREHILGIAGSLHENGAKNILITRVSKDCADFLCANGIEAVYHSYARICVAYPAEHTSPLGSIVIASGGTSDMAVCEEAAVTAETMGNKVHRLYDVGVAGLHRLLAKRDILMSARVVIAVAGMEGALASVVGGLVDCPVVAVPTSVGYGANFGGLSALLSMLNSCASGVSVVNIDNGFGAGFIADRINKMESINK